MFIDGVLVCLVVGWLRGGRLAGLTEISLRQFWLIPAAFLLRGGPATLARMGVTSVLRYGPTLQVVAYLVLFLALILNKGIPGMPILTLGVALNFIVIGLNQGRMPVSPWSLSVVGMSGALPALQSGALTSHGLLNGLTRLPWLADIIPIPRPYPLPKIISIGDIVMVLGVGQLVIRSMGAQGSLGRVQSPEPKGQSADGQTVSGS